MKVRFIGGPWDGEVHEVNLRPDRLPAKIGGHFDGEACSYQVEPDRNENGEYMARPVFGQML